jgi:magnesium transporter
MIRSIFYPPKGSPQRDLTPPELLECLNQPDGLLWVSLEKPDSAESDQILRDVFHFHPLAIEDTYTMDYQPAKVDDFVSYLFLIFHAIQPSPDFHNLETMEIDLFLGPNYLVTAYHDPIMPPVDAVWRRLERDERVYTNGSDFLCHAILDALVDDYMPVIDQMDDEIEWLEDQVLARPNPEILERILSLKHSVMAMRRIVGPQREMINRLSRDDFPQIDRQSRIYFRDIYDHLVRIQDLTESVRDIVSGAMDIYLNSTSLRLNEVMKALTIVSTIFLPLTFITGLYGMNFVRLYPDIQWPAGFLFVTITCIVIVFVMLAYFRRRNWF